MKIKDLPVLAVLGTAFKIPISDITSDRALSITLGQLMEYLKENVTDDLYHTELLEEASYEMLTAADMQEGVFYCELEEAEEGGETNPATYSNGLVLVDGTYSNGLVLVSTATYSNGLVNI